MGQVRCAIGRISAVHRFHDIIYAHCLAAQELRHTDAENRVGFVCISRIPIQML